MTSTPRLVNLTAAFLSALALTACSGTLTGPSVAPAAPAASLAIETNAVWHLQSMTNANGALQIIEDPGLFTLMLTDAGKVAAQVDCNRASGGYTISGSTLSMGPLASTKAYCGATLLAERSTYRVSTETVKDTTTLVWSRPTMMALANRYPRIRDNALWIASDYLDWYLAAHIALSCQTASQRLAGVLVSMAPLLGRSVPGGLELDVTNEELASAAHITSFTASRLLSEWHRQRAVIKRRGRVVLVAPDRLIRLSA